MHQASLVQDCEHQGPHYGFMKILRAAKRGTSLEVSYFNVSNRQKILFSQNLHIELRFNDVWLITRSVWLMQCVQFCEIYGAQKVFAGCTKLSAGSMRPACNCLDHAAPSKYTTNLCKSKWATNYYRWAQPVWPYLRNAKVFVRKWNFIYFLRNV